MGQDQMARGLKKPDPTSVEQRVAKITGQGSPLMRRAQTTGFQVANRRGLLNSSIAAGAAQNAILDAAIPIAGQDAATSFQREQAGLDRGLTQSENALTRQFQSGESEKDRGFSREQAGLDRSFSAEQSGFQRALEREQSGMDRALQERIAGWNLEASESQSAGQVVVGLESTYSQQFSAIMANPDLSADAREDQIRNLEANREKRLDLVEQVFDIDLGFQGLPPAAPAAAPAAPEAPAPPPRQTPPLNSPRPSGGGRGR